MASQSCVISLGARGGSARSVTRRAVISLGGRSGSTRALYRRSIISAGPFFTASPYASGTSFTRGTAIPKAMFPAAGTPFVFIDKAGNVRNNPVWERFLRMWWQDRMGGDAGPTMTEVQDNVVATRVQAVNAAATAASVEQLAVTNAESLAATVEVVQNNSLSGATNIPAPQRRAHPTNEIIP